ncbi:MAG: peptidylprolyl isomerase [Halobacteriovoraceae bacterium]|nr:peptidylprolyl isomerase [Halobacteriovoraceae bacterium]
MATVNNVPITKREFEISFQQNKMFLSPKPVTRKKVLNDMINRLLGIQRAKKQKIDKNPVVINKIEDVIYHAQISKDLEPQLKKIKVVDRDIKKYYQDNKEYRTAHILFRVSINPKKEEEEKALKKAVNAYKTLEKTPNKFSEMANKYSESTASVIGGDMGFQPAVNLAPEYYSAIKGKKIGHITPPVRTQFGYHIVKVLGVKSFNGINMQQYKQIIYNQKRDAIIENYFKDLRKKAKITINKENL